jgi:hypothetical protein
MIDLFVADFNTLNNEQRYSAMVEFARDLPNESNRHDFKTVWTNETLKDVAAFSNTFGGILVIGVEKNSADLAAKIVGVESGSELTTAIASAIATNISPTPPYDIMECHKPDQTNKRFCVIRVRSDSTLHLVTKKDVSPVWIRNADQTIRADAAQLRSLIDKERQSSALDVNQFSWNRAHQLFEDMIVGKDYAAELAYWPAGSWHRSETYFKVALIPTERRSFILDGRGEHRFNNLIHQNYGRITGTLGGASPAAADSHNRGADFYEYRWYHKNLNYEGRWRITSSLEVAHSTQIKYEENWSLADVIFYTILLIKITANWWGSFNYFGDAVLCADIKVENLPVIRGSSGQFLTLFNPAGGSFAIRGETLNLTAHSRQEAQAFDLVNFSGMRANLSITVTSIMNVLLRSLGHNLFWAEFEDNIRTILSGMS